VLQILHVIGEANLYELMALVKISREPAAVIHISAFSLNSRRGSSMQYSASHATAGTAASLNVTAHRANIGGDGHDLSFISTEVVNSEGNKVP
jgi:hypothetical protein